MRIHTICQRHGTTALVGPGTLIGELECVACIAEQDAAYRIPPPCCSRANIDCCGHDDYANEFADEPGWGVAITIESPNFCDRDHVAEESEVPF